jgi:membrane protease YdiL (CAAX protease family)
MDQQSHSNWRPLVAHLPVAVWGPWATFGFVILAIIVAMASGIPFTVLMDLSTDNVLANNPGLVLLMTAFSQVVFALAAILLTLKKPTLAQLALDRGPRRGWIDYAVGFGLCFILGAVVNSFRLYVLGHDIYADLKQLAFLFRVPIWPLSFLVVAVLAPIAEELLFRGVLLPGLARTFLGFWGAAAVSTLVWTALHIGNAYSIAGMLLVFMLGMIFSWLFAVTGSLRVPIAAHMLNNALACVLLQTGAV